LAVTSNSQSSVITNEIKDYDRILSLANVKIGAIGNIDITYYTRDFYLEIKGKIKSVKGVIPEGILFLFPELGINN
jgi:hypothetical protein